MFRSGNVTLPVRDMDRAIHFYTEVLGLKLAYRYGNHWASIELGKGLTIGLHPAHQTAPAAAGGPSIGLELSGPIEDAMRTLEGRGVSFQGAPDVGKSGKFVRFHDPDGNLLYLAELNWEHVRQGEGTYPGA
jgi:catechol 2,3-dioxygenase-like lactoylglutathione lyase family enzyme